MHVVIVGGGGYIGARCAEALDTQGDSVTIVDRSGAGQLARVRTTGANVVIGDARDAKVAAEIDRVRPDVILYLGGVTDTRIKDRTWMYRETIDPFRAVVHWAQRRRTRLVYASSAAVYGNGPAPMKESQPPSPHNSYGEAKLEMDRFAASLLGDGLSILGLRYFNVYGPGEQHKHETASMVLRLTLQLREHHRVCLFEHGEQRRDFVHIDDVVRATVKGLHARVTGVLNVGSGMEHSFRELAAVLAQSLGVEAPLFEYLPAPTNYQRRTCADLTQTTASLDYTPEVSFVDGVRAYARAEDAAGRR